MTVLAILAFFFEILLPLKRFEILLLPPKRGKNKSGVGATWPTCQSNSRRVFPDNQKERKNE